MPMRLRCSRTALRGSLSATTLACALGLLCAPAALATGTIGVPTEVDASLSCKDFDTAGILNETELLINPLPDVPAFHTDGVLAVTTQSFESTSGWLLYWQQQSTGQSIHHVGISGGGVAVLYSYAPPVTSDAGLHLPAAAPGLVTTQVNTPYPQATTARFCYSTPGETGFEGCTLGYWKVKQHHDSWPAGYPTGTQLQTVFGPLAYSHSFLQALSYKGGPGVEGGKRLLLKQAVAAFLNATSDSVDYPETAAVVVAQVRAALQTGDREVMLSLAATLDAYNNQGCPLN
jgi:hypothetical protein